MQLSDRYTGLFLIALGGVAAYGGSRLPPVPGQQIGPNVFPMVVGAGLVLCGALIALGIGRGFEDEAEADLAAHSAPEFEQRQAIGWGRGLMALVPPALLLFYVFAVDRLGFLLTAAVIVLTAAFALGARLRLAVPLALGAPVFVHLVFSKLLRVPLPPGLLPAPW
ncbi:MAG: tripartite tricarboxylate transporter TctB family protein [Hyphomonadaceae bacterium]|jgi:putative tricarboxylic transport membrane protein|nr:tripartite tricarboxylate transporter TctB family protein [Hyphomonadaceae bacterium]